MKTKVCFKFLFRPKMLVKTFEHLSKMEKKGKEKRVTEPLKGKRRRGLRAKRRTAFLPGTAMLE